MYKAASSTSTIQDLAQAGALKQSCGWKTALATVKALEPLYRTRCHATSADVGIDPTVELNKPTTHVNQEAWYDIEYGCYVPEDGPLPLEKDDLAPLLAEDNQPSPGLSQDAISPHSDGNTQCTSQEPRADTLPQPRRKDNKHDCGESVSELEKDMLQAFKEQEDLSSANNLNGRSFEASVAL